MDDYRNLQELLEQALKREAEALRKVKHLHFLLAESSISVTEGKPLAGHNKLCIKARDQFMQYVYADSIRTLDSPDIIWDHDSVS